MRLESRASSANGNGHKPRGEQGAGLRPRQDSWVDEKRPSCTVCGSGVSLYPMDDGYRGIYIWRQSQEVTFGVGQRCGSVGRRRLELRPSLWVCDTTSRPGGSCRWTEALMLAKIVMGPGLLRRSTSINRSEGLFAMNPETTDNILGRGGTTGLDLAKIVMSLSCFAQRQRQHKS